MTRLLAHLAGRAGTRAVLLFSLIIPGLHGLFHAVRMLPQRMRLQNWSGLLLCACLHARTWTLRLTWG